MFSSSAHPSIWARPASTLITSYSSALVANPWLGLHLLLYHLSICKQRLMRK